MDGNEGTEQPVRSRRRRLASVGLVATGLLAGGILAGSHMAGAQSAGTSPSASSSGSISAANGRVDPAKGGARARGNPPHRRHGQQGEGGCPCGRAGRNDHPRGDGLRGLTVRGARAHVGRLDRDREGRQGLQGDEHRVGIRQGHARIPVQRVGHLIDLDLAIARGPARRRAPRYPFSFPRAPTGAR